MHFASVFEKISRIIPEEPALVCEDKVVTWREYEDQAAKLANYLEKKVFLLIRKLDFTFITQMNTS